MPDKHINSNSSWSSERAVQDSFIAHSFSWVPSPAAGYEPGEEGFNSFPCILRASASTALHDNTHGIGAFNRDLASLLSFQHPLRFTQQEPCVHGIEVADHVQQAITVHVLESRVTEVQTRFIASPPEGERSSVQYSRGIERWAGQNSHRDPRQVPPIDAVGNTPPFDVNVAPQRPRPQVHLLSITI